MEIIENINSAFFPGFKQGAEEETVDILRK